MLQYCEKAEFGDSSRTWRVLFFDSLFRRSDFILPFHRQETARGPDEMLSFMGKPHNGREGNGGRWSWKDPS